MKEQPTTRVLILGGTGHIGSLTRAALGRVPKVAAVSGSRRADLSSGDVRIDVDDPKTFPQVDGFQCVINCTDTYRSPPDALIRYCLERPIAFLETTADTEVYLRWIDTLETRGFGEPRGAVVMGVGVFPGLSNLLAAHAAQATHSCKRLDVHLSWSVWSGAGCGTCEVMVQSLSTPARRYRNGELCAGPPVGKPIPTSFFPHSPYGFEIALPEAVLIHRSLGIPATTVYVSPRPRVPRGMIPPIGWLAARGLFRPGWVKTILRGIFRLIRARLLRNRSTSLKIVAVTNRCDAHLTGADYWELQCSDAFQSAAYTIASTVSLLTQRTARGPNLIRGGVHTLDTLLSLEQTIEEMRVLGYEGVRLTPHGQAPKASQDAPGIAPHSG